MTSSTFFIIFIPLLAIILLAVNIIFAPHNPYQEKDSVFECGFHSFLGQNRTQFSISFFIFALLFLLFDLEILLVYPYVVSAHTNGIYGLVIMLIFFLALTLGFVFELGKNALKIDSRQMITLINNKIATVSTLSYLNYKYFYFKTFKDNVRVFSTTTIRYMDPQESIINKIVAKNEAFKKDVELHSSLLAKKQKLDSMKAEEWNSFEKFTKQYIFYLNKEDRDKSIKLFDQGQKMDLLIAEKTSLLDQSKPEDLNKIVTYSEWHFKSKLKTFEQVQELLLSTFEKGSSNKSIPSAEVDAFYVLLGKRNEQHQNFIEYRDKYFNFLKTSLNKKVSNTDTPVSPAVTSPKSTCAVTDNKSSAITDNKSSGVTAEGGSIANKNEVSDELIDIVNELINLFT